MSSTDTTVDQVQATSTPQTDSQLNETSLGSWIAENKSLAIGLVVVLFLGVIGYGIFDHFNDKAMNEKAGKLHAVIASDLEAFQKENISADKLVSNFEAAWSDMKGFDGAATYALQVIDALRKAGANKEAYAMTTKALERISNRQSQYFLHMRAATFAEDLNQNDAALEHLNALLSSGVSYMQDKVYIDLGRLQLKTGDKEKAKSSFQYVLDQGTEEEFKRMARLYLSEL